MIIAQLTDGLGNQLFQYANARRLAHQRKAELKLDTWWYQRNTFRTYALDAFAINASKATWGDVAALCPREAAERVLESILPGRVASRLLRLPRSLGWRKVYRGRAREHVPGAVEPPLLVGRVASERHLHFDPKFLDCPDHVCLCGYWQCEKYFKEIEGMIRQEFQLKSPLSGQNQMAADRITGCNSVSLHIRRSDKVQDSSHTETSLEYCQRAMEFMRASVPSPRFFVFSDDWSWVRANLPEQQDIVHLSQNGPADAPQDLHLMSLCRHNITATSSLSWWGAWLNANPEKRVVHPPAGEWVRGENMNGKDVYPESWQEIS